MVVALSNTEVQCDGIPAGCPVCVALDHVNEQLPLRAQLLCKVPEGKVTTYGAMAAALSSAPRAVGQVSTRETLADVVCAWTLTAHPHAECAQLSSTRCLAAVVLSIRFFVASRHRQNCLGAFDQHDNVSTVNLLKDGKSH